MSIAVNRSFFLSYPPRPPAIYHTSSQFKSQLYTHSLFATSLEWICRNPTEQSKSRMSTVLGVYFAKDLCVTMPLSASLLWSSPSVQSDSDHFIVTLLAMNFQTIIKVGDYCPESVIPDKWFAWWCDLRWRKQKWTSVKTWFVSTDVGQSARKTTNNTRH